MSIFACEYVNDESHQVYAFYSNLIIYILYYFYVTLYTLCIVGLTNNLMFLLLVFSLFWSVLQNQMWMFTH